MEKCIAFDAPSVTIATAAMNFWLVNHRNIIIRSTNYQSNAYIGWYQANGLPGQMIIEHCILVQYYDLDTVVI